MLAIPRYSPSKSLPLLSCCYECDSLLIQQKTGFATPLNKGKFKLPHPSCSSKIKQEKTHFVSSIPKWTRLSRAFSAKWKLTVENSLVNVYYSNFNLWTFLGPIKKQDQNPREQIIHTGILSCLCWFKSHSEIWGWGGIFIFKPLFNFLYWKH